MSELAPRFMFPPHPAQAARITPEMLPKEDEKGVWLAQRKFNGSHIVIWLYKDQVKIWNRRGEPFGNYRLTEGMKKCLLCGLDRDYYTEMVLDGELLHTKAKLHTGKQAAENTIVLFDILYAEKYLTNLTTLERLDLLHKVVPNTGLEPKRRALRVTNYNESQLWIAETFDNDFNYRFWEMYDYNSKGEDNYPEIEGLMLKLKNAKNTNISNRTNDVLWMLRCRKTKVKTYQF